MTKIKHNIWTSDSYEKKFMDILFGVFGVGDDYLNNDMKESLKDVINKIYEDGFIDGSNEGNII